MVPALLNYLFISCQFFFIVAIETHKAQVHEMRQNQEKEVQDFIFTTEL